MTRALATAGPGGGVDAYVGATPRRLTASAGVPSSVRLWLMRSCQVSWFPTQAMYRHLGSFCIREGCLDSYAGPDSLADCRLPTVADAGTRPRVLRVPSLC